MSSKQAAKGALSLTPVFVLVAICCVSGALLGGVHMVTAPVIAAAEEQRAQEIYAALVPDAASFEELACETEGCTAALQALDASGEKIGYIVVAQSKGYGGQVPIAVAFDTAGTVTNITTMQNEETPGLDTRIADESYIGQYVGLSAEPLTADDVDLISGATISSKAALSAFDIAVEAYKEVS